MEAANGTVYQPFLYNATETQLQEFILLGLFVAGKKATTQQRKLNWFLELIRHQVRPLDDLTPLARIALISDTALESRLRFVGAGQYRRLVTGIRWLANNVTTGKLNLQTCHRDSLCKCPGIGLKTASFFVIYTRVHSDYACLDTHILRWLREVCGWENAPKSSPQSTKKYLHWETVFLEEARKLHQDPTRLDFDIWLKYSKKK